MTLLVIRGDLQSHSGYSSAARDYCALLHGLFDRIVGVDIHYSGERPFEPFTHPLVTEEEARSLAAAADGALVLSFTTPDHYCRYPRAVNVGLTFWETDRLPLHGHEAPPWVAPANGMDALWSPSSHTKEVFRRSGVTVPIRVVPWPVRAPSPCPAGLPDGAVFDLDRRPFFIDQLLALARLPELRVKGWNRLRRKLQPRAARAVLNRLRSSPAAVPAPAEHALLCVAQDVPRKGLLLFLSEWMEFKRHRAAGPWSLILKTSPINPRTTPFDLVTRFYEPVQALCRQLGVARSGVYLWAGDLRAPDYERLVQNTFGAVAPSFGEGFCGPAALAVRLGKPLVAPRHTSLADYVPEGHRYAFETRPVRVSFVDDPIRGVYDPASSWELPVPFGLSRALTRLATDAPRQRHEATEQARQHLSNWCSPERVRQVLAEEVQRLLGRAEREAA